MNALQDGIISKISEGNVNPYKQVGEFDQFSITVN